jgi:cyclophilin family peptidyl-prolyl cis-trans isomerase
VAALVLGLLWLGGVGALLALIFGLVALSATSRDPALGGRGMAIAGTILGAAGLLIPVAILAVAALFVSSSTSSGTANSVPTPVVETTVRPGRTVSPIERPAETPTAPSTVPAATITGDTPCPAADGSSARAVMFANAPPMCIIADTKYTATISTNKGDLVIALDAARAPLTVNNFVVLARYHYFDHTVCHRIIESFVVQCGDPTGTGSGSNPGYSIPDELPATPYTIGDLAMANTGSPDTGGSQFFLVSGSEGAALPLQYSKYGKVTAKALGVLAALDAAHGPDPTRDGSDPTACRPPSWSRSSR